MQIENCSINQRTLSIYMTYMLLYSGGASVPHAAKFTPNETDHPNFYVHKKAKKKVLFYYKLAQYLNKKL